MARILTMNFARTVLVGFRSGELQNHHKVDLKTDSGTIRVERYLSGGGYGDSAA
jgi:hypothetical protein